MKYAAMIRAKNEARWIHKAIQSLLPLCQRIFVLDDNSSDETARIANSFAETIVYRSPFTDFSEIRDKEWLLRKVDQDTDYVICIDGDEELEPAGADKIKKLTANGDVMAARLRILYLWNDPGTVRVDGCYRDYARASLFRYDPDKTAFKSAYDTTLHCTNVPAGYVRFAGNTDIRLLHWGYYDRELRIKKYQWYNQIDPGNEIEDQYRHVVCGDIISADYRGKHAGPLTLEPLSL